MPSAKKNLRLGKVVSTSGGRSPMETTGLTSRNLSFQRKLSKSNLKSKKTEVSTHPGELPLP